MWMRDALRLTPEKARELPTPELQQAYALLKLAVAAHARDASGGAWAAVNAEMHARGLFAES